MAPSEQETLRRYREAMGAEAADRQVRLCGAPRPDRESIVCERPAGHRGTHQSGLSEWPRAVR